MILAILILYVFLSAFSRVCYKLAMRSANEVSVVMTVQGLCAVMSLPLAIWFFPTSDFDWPLLFAQAILWCGFVYLEVRSLRTLDLGLAGLFGSLEYVFHLVISVAVFRESLVLAQGLGALLIIVGILISADWRISELRAGLRYQVLAVMCLIVVFPIDAVLVRQVSPWFVGAFAYLGPASLLFLWRVRERSEAIKLARDPRLVTAAVASLSSYCLVLYVLTQWNYSDTVTGSQLMTCFSLALGWIFLRERAHPFRRLIACALIVIGVGCFRAFSLHFS